MTTLGIDLGTSALKVVLTNGDEVLALAARPLTVERPHPGWSEQDPQAWWTALVDAVDEIQSRAPAALAGVTAIGLAGQMHGATLVDCEGRTLRPCILWNDGRAEPQCAELEAAWPALRQVTGNPAMAGFTAPKLLWVRSHEPQLFDRIHKVLLPKAWLRWRLTGDFIEDLSDASGTLWLDVAARRWSREALSACELDLDQMPSLVEGNAAAGHLKGELRARWGMATAPMVAGGAGDNAAGAVGLGAVHAGDAFVSLGTSGVLWATTGHFAPNPDLAVHAFCHALPDTWHQMGVLLSAASALSWWSGVAGLDETRLLAEAEAEPSGNVAAPAQALFAPYLAGERTPYNDSRVRGGFAELAASTTRSDLTRAVIDGVGYAFADARDALEAAGTRIVEADVIGGGAQSDFWVQRLADILNRPLHRVAHGDLGCALGAARLARMADGAGLSVACRPARVRSFEPRPAAVAAHAERLALWRRLYPACATLRRSP